MSAEATGIDPQVIIMAILGIALIVSETLAKTKKFKSNGVLDLIINILKVFVNKKKQ